MNFPNAILYDDTDFNNYDINSNDLTVVSPGIVPYNNMVINSKNIISDYDLFNRYLCHFIIRICGTMEKLQLLKCVNISRRI